MHALGPDLRGEGGLVSRGRSIGTYKCDQMRLPRLVVEGCIERTPTLVTNVHCTALTNSHSYTYV